MPYIFHSLPADSADLDTYNGYHVSRSPRVANGGPVRRADPSEGPIELILYHPSSRSSILSHHFNQYARRPMPTMARKVKTAAWRTRSFFTNTQLASMLVVPALCFALVWGIGRL